MEFKISLGYRAKSQKPNWQTVRQTNKKTQSKTNKQKKKIPKVKLNIHQSKPTEFNEFIADLKRQKWASFYSIKLLCMKDLR